MDELEPQLRAKLKAVIQILESIDEFLDDGSIVYEDENGNVYSFNTHIRIIKGD